MCTYCLRCNTRRAVSQDLWSQHQVPTPCFETDTWSHCCVHRQTDFLGLFTNFLSCTPSIIYKLFFLSRCPVVYCWTRKIVKLYVRGSGRTGSGTFKCRKSNWYLLHVLSVVINLFCHTAFDASYVFPVVSTTVVILWQTHPNTCKPWVGHLFFFQWSFWYS